MQLSLMVIGRTEVRGYIPLIEEYAARIGHFLPFTIDVVPDTASSALRKEPSKLKAYEREQILKRLKPGDKPLLLDEKGDVLSSRGLAKRLQKVMLSGVKRWIWIVGGPFGFDEAVYEAVPERISLSAMTFPHDMVRLIATEQLYRALSILHNQPYHHD